MYTGIQLQLQLQLQLPTLEIRKLVHRVHMVYSVDK